MTTLAVIGAGNMGGAIVRGAIEQGILAAREIVVIDARAEVRERFAELGCVVAESVEAIELPQQVLVAVKPQGFSDLAEQIMAAGGALSGETVVISVMAGLSSRAIRRQLGGSPRVIRVMPNTPCSIGAGMSAIAMGEGAQPTDAALAESLFAAVGEVVHVDEHQLHTVTAISGSGPAYVFLLAESLEQAGIAQGLHRPTARTLAYQMIYGAGRLLIDDAAGSAANLRAAVTSPGGTTAAALEVMFERELPQIIAEAVLAARERGEELGAPSDNQQD